MINEFFNYARERYAILLKRRSGALKPWTADPILQTGRFCNVFREDDRTTQWFHNNVRGPMRDMRWVLPATVIFRWFNRTTTGEAIFLQPNLQDESVFEEFMECGYSAQILHDHILRMMPRGPWVTGAYTINTLSAGIGHTKLMGVCRLIEMWFKDHPDWAEKEWESIEDFTWWCQGPCLKEFMTYEVACDLRYTSILEGANDINLWANAGPGAVRGLNRIQGREVNQTSKKYDYLDEMRMLLYQSRFELYWNNIDWPAWDLRTVEHTLCEFDKYERVRAGEGQTRGVFNGSG